MKNILLLGLLLWAVAAVGQSSPVNDSKGFFAGTPTQPLTNAPGFVALPGKSFHGLGSGLTNYFGELRMAAPNVNQFFKTWTDAQNITNWTGGIVSGVTTNRWSGYMTNNVAGVWELSAVASVVANSQDNFRLVITSNDVALPWTVSTATAHDSLYGVMLVCRTSVELPANTRIAVAVGGDIGDAVHSVDSATFTIKKQ